MSVKRQATTELNHENWDQEDPEEHEEMGSFKSASRDVLEKRVIRTAKRRVPASDEAKKTIFGGFGGFNKTQPSSFDFLSKLTNVSNSTESSKTDTSMSSLFTGKPESTSSLFNSKPESSSSLFTAKAASPNSGSGIFAIKTSSTNSTFGTVSTTQSSLFAVSAANTSPAFSTVEKTSGVIDSPFKTKTIINNSENNSGSSQVSSGPVSFGIPATTANKSLFSSNSNSTPFKIQPTSNATTDFGTKPVPEQKKSDEESNNDKKFKYYSKLKGLNESVSSWIKQHVEKTPLCILSPIFKDYETYLKEIQDEFHGSGKQVANKKQNDNSTTSELKQVDQNISPKLVPVTESNNKGSSLFNSPASKPPFTTQNDASTEKPATFSFGIKNSSPSNASNVAATGFSLGTTSSTAPTTSSIPFGTNANTNGSPSFSFGASKPFSFNYNVQAQQTTEKKDEANDDEDAPPKVEFTPVIEENSVFDKRCKVFVKKDGNFVDKGVGTLYLKKIEESGKHQLLIRANTNLGTVLVNLILVSGIPTQRMGKNNVMLVCIPTPDAKPPPTPILIRVKTSEEADELLETLNKYKT